MSLRYFLYGPEEGDVRAVFRISDDDDFVQSWSATRASRTWQEAPSAYERVTGLISDAGVADEVTKQRALQILESWGVIPDAVDS